MDEETDELLAEFLVESFENLDEIDQDLVSLEQTPDATDILQRIFRAFHTIKGTCGFLGYETLGAVTHAAETLLARLRDGAMAYDAEVASALLRSTDAVRELLTVIERTKEEGSDEHLDLIAELHHLAERTAAHDAAPSTDVQLQADDDAEPGPRLGELLVERGVTTEADVAIALVRQADLGDPRPIGEVLIDAGAVDPEDVRSALSSQQHTRAADATLRVDVSLLDSLVTLVGELVLTRNQIRRLTGNDGVDSTLVIAAQRLNGVTAELQSHVMKTRMQPIGAVWSKLPRIVRDLAVQCEKAIRVDMHGQGTELDKAIVEAIRDPLTHMVRNAVDHGIESPAERVAAGKPEEGVLTLRAFHESGNVHIEIADDGRGIDVTKVKAKAVRQQLITEDQAARMTDREAVDLVFRAGFSTAEAVSNLSGRGVGMDVVRTNISRIGGTVECDNHPGAGTTFKVKIPLTLAIVPALITRGGGERFAVPHANLVELVGLGTESSRAIESVQGAPVYRLRDRMLPIVHLNAELNLTPPASDTRRSAGTIVVLRADGHEFGLVVDEVIDTEEIVVKPLPAHVDAVPVFSGCTVMGDGDVALILDVRGIAEVAGVLDPDGAVNANAETTTTESNSTADPVLIVRVDATTRAALALDNIERLEVFDPTRVELAAGHPVVQYRGALLPLLDLSATVGAATQRDSSDELVVVVYADGHRSVGLVIERVVDIVEEHTTNYEVPYRFGVVGSTIVRGDVTDLIDVAALVDAMPASFAALVNGAIQLEASDAV